tara:strand:- start:5062 stop:8070 length:3009 start_codon:yes stop_codon:yes gene_type:complete
MTTNFNPRNKLIFNHYLSTDGTVVSSDEMRKLFLNYLIYKGFQSEKTLTNDENLNLAIDALRYCTFTQENNNKFSIKIGVNNLTSDQIPDDIHKKLIEKFATLDSKAQTTQAGQVFQDYNFRPEGLTGKNKISFSVRTVTKKLQKTDISSNDDFFTSGELNPEKDETTLKFAYAFKTTKVDGELELISKQTELATNYKEWQVKADNKNELSKEPISKLQNLIYLTDQTDSIEKNIEAEGGEGDIGIDKAYNVVTIQVPPLEGSSASVITYINSAATPKINGVLTQDTKEGRSQYDAAILDYFLSELDGINNTKTKSLITGFADYIVRYYGFTANDATNFRDQPANSITSVKKQLDLYNERIAKQKSLKNQLATAITSFFKIQSQDYEKYFNSLEYNTLNKQFQIFTLLSTPFNFNKFIAKTFAIENPQNITMANLFKGAIPVDNLAKGYSYGSVQNNLINKRGRLIGLKLVKSEQPLDPSLYQNWLDSIVQTYHIPIRLKEDSQQIRIFDSQIIYGKTYYYTLLGIYNVDGKFYYYDNLTLTTRKEPPTMENPEIVETKAEIDTTLKQIPDGSYQTFPGTLYKVGSQLPRLSQDQYIIPTGENKFIASQRTRSVETGEAIFIYYFAETFGNPTSSQLIIRQIGQAPVNGVFDKFTYSGSGILQEINSQYNVSFNVNQNLINFIEIQKIQGIQKEFFDRFDFDLFETNSSRIFELPLQPSLEVDNINVAPVTPDVTFVALADVNNKIKIKFDESVQFDYLAIKPDAAFNTLNVSGNKSLVEKIKLKSKEIEPNLEAGMVLARSENDLLEIHTRKLDRPPTSLQDLVDNGEKFVLNYLNGETAYISNIIPNQKYYYTFISRDIVGLYSNASFTYEVEVIEDSGYVYTKVNVYEYPVEDNKVITKNFQKLLKVKPSFEQLQPFGASSIGSGMSGVYTTTVFPDGSQLNPGGQPPKFKIRVRSKKSKRIFDINLKYTQKVQQIQTKALLEQIKQYSELIDEEVSEA